MIQSLVIVFVAVLGCIVGQLNSVERDALNEIYVRIGCPPSICPRFTNNGLCLPPNDYCQNGSLTQL